jgi:hypothetical protein
MYEVGSHIPVDGIHHSHRRDDHTFYKTLTGCAMQRKRSVSCEVLTGSYIPEGCTFFIAAVKASNLTNH